MEKKSIEKISGELKDLFEVVKENEFVSYEVDNKFMIDKRQFARFEVLSMLQEYFSNTSVDGGYVKVGQITFAMTDFEILEGRPV
jgi:hypothetical protein